MVNLAQISQVSETIADGPGRQASARGAGRTRTAISPPRQYYVIDEAVVRRHIGIRQDPAIMPNQLRHMALKAEQDEFLTVRVIPFTAGAQLGLHGAFTLREFDGAMPDLLYRDSGRDTPSRWP
jgi:uncharacterized protein DUF5753